MDEKIVQQAIHGVRDHYQEMKRLISLLNEAYHNDPTDPSVEGYATALRAKGATVTTGNGTVCVSY